MVVLLSRIVHGLCGECWEFIQIQLIKVHEDWASRLHPEVCVGVIFSNLGKHTHSLFIYSLRHISAFILMHHWYDCVTASNVGCHVYGDAHDRNLFSSRFTPDMGNATLLMVTRPHPGKPSRAEWEMGWRSCWISSRMSICPSGERQVSLKTICPI